MRLRAEEQAMLNGELGPAARKAMEIVTALGEIYGASELVPVASVQVAGVSYKNLGPAGLQFLREWAEEGARVQVPTFLNPAGMDLEHWRELGIDESFAHQQRQVIEAFAAMGINTTCTCTPYYVDHVPSAGAHVAWAESSAVSFANSVLGARTNREGGPSALAAAISGRVAKYGFHCDQGRLATVSVTVKCEVRSLSDWGALGFLVGKKVGNAVPFFRGFSRGEGPLSSDPWLWEKLKALGAAMAASGAVSLYHIEGVTPEAREQQMLAPRHDSIVITSLEPAYRDLSGDGVAMDIDLVWLGCPHSSLQEVARLAAFSEGSKFRPSVWVTTSRRVRELAEAAGYVSKIEAAGGRVVSDTCVIVAPLPDRFQTMATLSAKGGYYAPSYAGLNVRYGSWEQLQTVMLTGRWEESP